jgi:signal transduction histidine kinase
MTTFRPLVQHELDRYLQIMLRVRVAGSLGLLGLGIAFAVWHPVWWKVLSAMTVGLSVGLLGVTALHKPLTESVHPEQIPWLTGSILLVQIMLVTLTGGIQSPLIIMFPLVNLLLTITHPGRALRALRTAVLLLAIWGLALVDAMGLASSLVLPLLQGDTGRGAPPAYGVGLAFFLSVAIAMGAYHGGRLRQAFDRAQQLTTEAQAEVIDAERRRSRDLLAMSGTLAHELKNPLASIRGLAVLVTRKQAVGSREREQMEVLGSEAERMGGIIQEFLSFSRPTTPLTLEQEVSLERLVRDALTLHQAMAAEQRVTLDFVHERSGLCTCDPRKIMQIIINLLHNALDASPEGGTVSVRLTQRAGDGIRLELCDEGAGLSPEVRDRLFRPGFTTKANGTGLGLTISRMIAQQHGGTLTLTDHPSGGCIARLHLPIRPPDHPPMESA